MFFECVLSLFLLILMISCTEVTNDRILMRQCDVTLEASVSDTQDRKRFPPNAPFSVLDDAGFHVRHSKNFTLHTFCVYFFVVVRPCLVSLCGVCLCGYTPAGIKSHTHTHTVYTGEDAHKKKYIKCEKR